MKQRPILTLLFTTFFLLALSACAATSNGVSLPTIDLQGLVESVRGTTQAQKIDISLPQVTPVPIIITPNTQANDGGIPLEATLTNLYEKANPSVVQLLNYDDGGSGTGWVYDSLGHIVTNNHVVGTARKIEVIYANGERRPADVLGTDPDSDLAVVRVVSAPSDVLPLPLSDLAEVKVGQFVIAIGNPFGEQGSMSLGIVSGLGRSLMSQRTDNNGLPIGYQLPSVIQTDAPINPGNSGGPLLNLEGEVVGVNAAIRTQTGTNSGVGFSIPVNAVKLIVPSLIKGESYRYPFMGIGVDELEYEQAQALGFDRTAGVYLTRITPNGPAAQAGLRSADNTGRGGDLIIALDGQPISNFDDLNSYLVFHTQVGQQIQVTLLRNSSEQTISLTLGARP